MRCYYLLVFIFLLTAGCSQSSSEEETAKKKAEEQRMIDQLAEQKAEKLAKDQDIIQEAEKIAEAKAKAEQEAEIQRDQMAVDLQQRAEIKAEENAKLLQAAAEEKLRRDTFITDLKYSVDSLKIKTSSITNGDKTTVFVRINNELKNVGDEIISPNGISYRFKGTSGNFFNFEYIDKDISVSLKRSENGLSFATSKNITPLASGIPNTDIQGLIDTSSIGNIRALSPGLSVISATYGADNVQRDVKDILKSKVDKGRLNLSANSTELGGDPAFGKVKTLHVKYIANGRLAEKSFQEGDHVSLP